MIRKFIDYIFKIKMRSCVLCFHSVSENGYEVEKFKKLIHKLIDLGYEFPDPKNITQKPSVKEIYISFDDGYADNFSIIEDFLKPLGIKPIIFVVTGLLDGEVESNSCVGLKEIPHLSYANCRKIKDDAVFGYHTHMHDDLYANEMKDINQSFMDGFKRFNEEFSFGQPLFFAYPFGYLPKNKEEFVETLKNLGVSLAFTTSWGPINSNSPFFINRVVIGDNDSVSRSLLKISGVLDLYAKYKWSGPKYGR